MIRDACILGGIVRPSQIRGAADVITDFGSGAPAHRQRMMTPRTLRWTAFTIALAVQGAMIIVHGTLSDWCFCAITDNVPDRIPPPFVLRFLELVRLPAVWAMDGLRGLGGSSLLGDFGLEAFFVFGLIGWFVAVLALLHGMACATRIRIASSGPDGRRAWLASRESVRPTRILLLGAVLVAAGLAGGAMARRRWLMEAEQVFAATIAAASVDRPLPAGVQFWMWEWRGDDMVDVKPEARYMVRVDPRESGDRFLDRFVVPYSYGGAVRFESGRRYYFDVFRDGNGWSVGVNRARRPRYW